MEIPCCVGFRYDSTCEVSCQDSASLSKDPAGGVRVHLLKNYASSVDTGTFLDEQKNQEEKFLRRSRQY